MMANSRLLRFLAPALLQRSFSCHSPVLGKFSLTDDLIETFQKDGVVCLRGVFTKDEVDAAAKGIDENMTSPSIYHDYLKDDDGTGFYFNDYVNWKNIANLQNFVLNSSASEIAGRLMKSKRSMFFHDQVFVKTGSSNWPVPWHQDQPYYFINGRQTCSLWMPVTHVKHGALCFVKGSHLKEWYMPTKFGTLKPYDFADDLDRHYEPSDAANPKEEDIVSWDLQPGDCLAFNYSCLHGSEGTPSDVDRCVLSTRWCGDDAVIATRAWQCSPPPQLFKDNLTPTTEMYKYKSFPTLWQSDEVD